VRRAKLYYLRGRVGKRARVAERRWGIEDDLVLAEAEEPTAIDSEGASQEEVDPVAPEEPEAEAADADEPAAENAAESSAEAEAAAEPAGDGKGSEETS
jgi:large subunit ribosomal protein L19